jgi:adenine-specific DNA methylase
MIPKQSKRLAEVDFPIAEVSRQAAREKAIRHGHPSTLHLWWARRPLASCRAMLLGLLLPDPTDPHCPAEFKDRAHEALAQLHSGARKAKDEDLRGWLLKFIADFANLDLAADRTYLEVARALVRAAYPEEPPLVVDPFAGGCSIPLEVGRLGCQAIAYDYNAVAYLFLRASCKSPQKYDRPGWRKVRGQASSLHSGDRIIRLQTASEGVRRTRSWPCGTSRNTPIG